MQHNNLSASTAPSALSLDRASPAQLQKLTLLAFWVFAIIGAQWIMWQRGLMSVEAMQQLMAVVTSSPAAPLIYIALFAIRPLMLMPATVLALAGGFVFGPVWGALYTVLAVNGSATVAYLVGFLFGRGALLSGVGNQFVKRHAERLRANSFEAILVSRLIFVPYDLISYLSGLLHIRWGAFALATALGSLPGTLSVVLFGASVGQIEGGAPALNGWVLVASLAMWVVSLGLPRLMRRAGVASALPPEAQPSASGAQAAPDAPAHALAPLAPIEPAA